MDEILRPTAGYEFRPHEASIEVERIFVTHVE
ncbi:hypothetical protein AB7M49_004160 [Bradyrhizobium elkanii]